MIKIKIENSNNFIKKMSIYIYEIYIFRTVTFSDYLFQLDLLPSTYLIKEHVFEQSNLGYRQKYIGSYIQQYITQLKFTYSKSTIEASEKYIKSDLFKVNSKDVKKRH